MSSHLPDDPNQWPSNPYRLLGVPHGCPENVLKRAYTRLIRIYKPELFPEQFRRIRAAYEQALQWVNHWTNAADDDPDEQPGIVGSVEPSVPVNDELDELWQLAITGNTEAVYHGLIRLTAPGATAARASLRLYWLLTLWPELDNERTPADWLADHLRLAGGFRFGVVPVRDGTGPARQWHPNPRLRPPLPHRQRSAGAAGLGRSTLAGAAWAR